jgi:diphosphomevalonate decarboxylase
MKSTEEIIEKKVEWTSPSNIALVKYWGKHGNQLPANASLSMSLKNSRTRTILSLLQSPNLPELQFFFGGVEEPSFQPKIQSFLKNTKTYFPFLQGKSLKIESWNTFPHSAGIASSASSMSALALCLCDISNELHDGKHSENDFYRMASETARIGSGSASRSVYGGFSVWGKTRLIANSSDEFAVSLDFNIHPTFSKLHDAILIVNPAKKKTSSSAGHELMNLHPYANERYKLAEKNLEIILNALETGNTDNFVRITENEALGLHSLMMSSDPGFMLIESGTIAIINKIRMYREKTGRFLCFTLDAGPNVHLLYPESEKQEIAGFIENDLLIHCHNRQVIWDECGDGPVKVL